MFAKIPATPSNPSSLREEWREFKNQPYIMGNGAVFSIQSVDDEKIALEPSEFSQFIRTHHDLNNIGNGHAAFAMAKALNLPIGVVRTDEKNREEFYRKVGKNIQNNGLIVMTGHGTQEGSDIQGTYKNDTKLSPEQMNDKKGVELDEKIKRDPNVLVNSVLGAGTLKRGDSVTILLSICYGAYGERNSFAQKLANEFAANGINTTIIASQKPVVRFGSNKIESNGTIIFGKNVGISYEDIFVFSTKIDSRGKFYTNIYQPFETLELGPKGLVFSDNINDLVEEQNNSYKGFKIYSAEYTGDEVKGNVCALRRTKTFPNHLVFLFESEDPKTKQKKIEKISLDPSQWKKITDVQTLMEEIEKEMLSYNIALPENLATITILGSSFIDTKWESKIKDTHKTSNEPGTRKGLLLHSIFPSRAKISDAHTEQTNLGSSMTPR